MVTMVTRPRGGSGPRLVAARRRFPRSHVLDKLNGDTLDGEWDVTNNGDETGFARLVFTGVQGGAVGSLVQVNPGVTVTATISLSVLDGHPEPSTIEPVFLNLNENDSGGNLVAEIASHQFTINIGTSTSGPQIVAVGEPTIT